MTGVDSGAASVVIAAHYHGIACDYAQVRHRHGGSEPLSVADVLRALRELGLKARLVRSRWPRLAHLALPALLLQRDGSFAVLGKVAEGKALVQHPAEQGPRVVERAALEQGWSGRLILVARRAPATSVATRFGLAWFARALARYKAVLAEVLLASFCLQGLALVAPLFSQVIIDKVLVHRTLGTLDVLMLGLAAVILFEAVLGGLRSYLLAHTTNRVDVTLGARLLDHLLGLPLAYFMARPAGQSVARLRELESIRAFLTGSALTLVVDLFFTVVFVAVMWWYSWQLTLVVLATLPPYAAISLALTPLLRRRLQERFERGAINQSFLVETVTAMETVKAMAIEPQLRRTYEEQLAAYVTAGFRAGTLALVGQQAIQLVNKLGAAAVLYLGAKLAIRGEITVGELVAFNMLAGQVAAPVLRVAQLWQDFQEARLSIDRLGDILNTPTEPTTGRSRAALPRIEGRIGFENVSFRYTPGGPKVLGGLSFEIQPGEVVGLVGASGSGKSTIAKLTQRLYLPESGRILIDGVDIAQVDPAWLRRQIGVVPQECVLFHKTVRENIALTDPALPLARVVEAARLAGAHEFVTRLPQGYDTLLGERGASLSGGQRQRLAIARAIVADPRILIFDEATSALDQESEEAILRNLPSLCRKRTVLVITHRPAWLRFVTRTIKLRSDPDS